MDLVGSKPALRGQRVTLRPIDARDAAAMHASTFDAESMRLTGTQPSFTLEEIETWCASLPGRGDRVDLAIRVYAKLGFVREGVRREALRQDGAWHDAIRMGLLRREFSR